MEDLTLDTSEQSTTAAPSGSEEVKTGTDAATPPKAAAKALAKSGTKASASKATSKPKAAKAEPKPPAGRVLMVSAAQEGFRRAGRAWTKQATAVPEGDLTGEQVRAILEEPMLTAYWAPIPGGADPAATSSTSETVRAKFVVRKNEDGTVTLETVTSGNAENDAFFHYTPWGKLEMGIVNPAAAGFFTVGREVYLDFMPAD